VGIWILEDAVSATTTKSSGDTRIENLRETSQEKDKVRLAREDENVQECLTI
jgi:hypothetical protein